MSCWTALTTLPGRASAENLAEAMERLTPAPHGIGTIAIEDGSGLFEVGGYFTEKPDAAGLMLLAMIHGAADFAVSKVPDTDWVAAVRRELTPVEAGRFVVYGSHDRDTVPKHKLGLEIEAAMAFGTGHHGTTEGCLLALSKLADHGLHPARVADVGCGTGVLAMAAARLWPARTQVIAGDIDDVAVETAQVNLRHNGFGTRVPVVRAAGFRAPALWQGPGFDLVLANILAGPLKRLAPDMARRTRPGARVILSGILARQRIGVERVYEGHGFIVENRIDRNGWATLTLHRIAS